MIQPIRMPVENLASEAQLKHKGQPKTLLSSKESQDTVKFGYYRSDDDVEGWFSAIVLGIAAIVGVGFGIKSMVNHSQGDTYADQCEKEVYQTQNEQCEINAINDGNIHVRDFGIHKINSLKVSDAEKAQLYLTAMRDGNDDLYVEAQKELKEFIQTVQDPALKESLQNLLLEAPGFEHDTKYPDRLNYSNGYRQAEAQVRTEIGRLSSQPG